MSDEPFSDFDQIYPPFGGLKDPTTAETPTMTDIERISEKSGCDKPYVRAVVAAMQQPSEELISAMMRGFRLDENPRQAMRDALVNGMCFILNEPKD